MRVIVAVLLLAAAVAPAAAPAREPLTIGYLGLEDDPRHAEQRTYADIVLRGAVDPFQGAETALREGKILGRALGLDISLRRVRAARADELASAALDLAEEGVRLILLDAPAAAEVDAARQTRGEGLILFNVSASEDYLRGAGCQPHLLHVIPSEAMLADALAQYAAAKRWTNVLVLRGPSPDDAHRVEAFRRASSRTGLSLVDTRVFSQSNDPREREQNRAALLTEGDDYDLIFVADSDAEFGRHVAYRSAAPRPVIGDTGLMASAWHWSWERHGAPQLNQRFERLAGRRMTDADWAAWAAVSLILRSAAAVRSGDAEEIVRHMRQQDLTFDTYKGSPGSFRPWDNQLRQPILLHTSDAVIGRAPIQGFLHPTNYADTLGVDQPESACHMDAG